MKIIKLLFAFVLLLSSSCKSKFEMSESDRVVDHMILEFAETVAVNGLRPAGIGGGLNHETGKHKEFGITFVMQEEVKDVARARALFVETADAFLGFINTKEDIHEYIDVIPITILNIDMSIIFLNALSGNIVDVFNCGKRLCYHTESAQPGEEPWEKVHEETFEEAHAMLDSKLEKFEDEHLSSLN